MDDLKQQLARSFRSARLRKGLTQEAVAEEAGVTMETVSNSERGESLVTLPVFLKLAAALQIDLNDIVNVAPVKRKISPRRMRLEGDLAQLSEQMTEPELELLIGIGRLLHGRKKV